MFVCMALEREKRWSHGRFHVWWCMLHVKLEWWCLKCWECIFGVWLQLDVFWLAVLCIFRAVLCWRTRRTTVRQYGTAVSLCFSRCTPVCTTHARPENVHARPCVCLRTPVHRQFQWQWIVNSRELHDQAHDQCTVPCVRVHARAHFMHARASAEFQKNVIEWEIEHANSE